MTPDGPLLVSGATGFVGAAVAAQARAAGWNVVAVGRRAGPGLVTVDPLDPQSLVAAMDRIRPAALIDAAGVLPGPAGGDPDLNVALTRSWIEALRRAERPVPAVFAGSAAVYGAGAAMDRATREDDPMRPVGAYGIAKLRALDLVREAAARDGLDLRAGLLFNLIGAGQSPDLVPRTFVRAALRAASDGSGVVPVGAVESLRDFLAVADAADGLLGIALHGFRGAVWNVASGRPTRIADVLDRIAARIPVAWRPDPSRIDPVPVCYGDPARLKAAAGWTPRQTIADALDAAITAEAQENEKRVMAAG